MEYAIPALLTRKEIAARTHSSLRKVNDLLNSPSGPRLTRIGASVLVRSDHFVEWLDRLASPLPPSPNQNQDAST